MLTKNHENRESDDKVGNAQSMIFTVYGDYIRHYGNKIWIGSLISLLKEFGHNEQSIRVAVSRIMKQGWLQSEKKGNKSYYFLTERGEIRMEEAGDRIFKLKAQEWDGKWRMLMYTIPEEKRQIRDELRKELLWSGFGTFSNGCWISPNNLEKEVNLLIEKYGIQSYVDFFMCEYKGPGGNKELVKKSWPLGDIEGKYEKFISIYSDKYKIDKNKMKIGKMTPAQCFVERTNLVHEYRKFLFTDPGLPEELLPNIWKGDEATLLFERYYKLLAQSANNFFEEVFQKDNDLRRKDKSYDAEDHPLLIN